MKIAQIVSTLALTAAISLSSPVFAQMMIGDTAVPEDKMTMVTEKCASFTAADAAKTEPAVGASADATGSNSGGADTAQAESPDPAAEENLDEMIAGLTAEECAAMMPAQ